MDETRIRTIIEWQRMGIIDYILKNHSEIIDSETNKLLESIKYNTIKESNERINIKTGRRNSK
jgi:hypothetical protein